MHKIPEWITNPDPSLLMTDNYLVLDFETTNLDKGDALNKNNSLVLAVYGKGYDKRAVFANEYEQRDLVDAVAKSSLVVAHNAKFELQWLARCGIDIGDILVYDTMLGEYILAGNRKFELGLGIVAQRYGMPGKEQYVDKCIKSGICPSSIPRSMLKERCLYDVNVTERIFLEQRRVLADSGLLPCMFTKSIFTPVLADIESQGLLPDSERVYKEYTAEHQALQEDDRILDEMTGGINTRSSKQKAEFVYDVLGFKELSKRGVPIRTEKGARKADTKTLAALKATTAKQKKFVEIMRSKAKHDARLSKALNHFKKCCDNNDILYANFNQTVTVTHRLSSSGKGYGVQFQNLPREYKKLFRAKKEGFKIAEIDGAQIEFRVAAHLGRDKVAMEDIINEVDVHTFTANTLTEAGQPTTRQEAKAHTFKPLYGGTSGTKAEQAYYAAFKERYPGIASVQQKWIKSALDRGHVQMETGLKFYFKAKVTPSGYIEGTSDICNYPVQYLATAEIVPIGLTYLWHSLRARNLQSRLVNTVHDSGILEVNPEEEELVRDVSINSFTKYVYYYLKRVYNISFTVPLGAGWKCGTFWGDGEEMKISVAPPEAAT